MNYFRFLHLRTYCQRVLYWKAIENHPLPRISLSPLLSWCELIWVAHFNTRTFLRKLSPLLWQLFMFWLILQFPPYSPPWFPPLSSAISLKCLGKIAFLPNTNLHPLQATSRASHCFFSCCSPWNDSLGCSSPNTLTKTKCLFQQLVTSLTFPMFTIIWTQ